MIDVDDVLCCSVRCCREMWTESGGCGWTPSVVCAPPCPRLRDVTPDLQPCSGNSPGELAKYTYVAVIASVRCRVSVLVCALESRATTQRTLVHV